ncbi:transposase [Achromobacter xylosoxidans]|uniref:transposase n=1 Tax=Alcaligenes xylosoxydans xylosoxydans TaxID=85698 RepID=UPI00292E4D74|nr:transposase [Achromobacter xylosoxidans]WOB77082.1 transposase [Achromobacter xylosoxidans]
MLYRMYRMGLREFAGFMHDYWRGRGVELPVPSFGHLSDLFASLDITVRRKCVRAAERLNEGEPVTVIVDSTGLRFSHAGAWYEKKYGKKAERTPWRMMHLAMDAEGDVLAVEITDTGTGDSSGLDLLLPQVGKMNLSDFLCATGHEIIPKGTFHDRHNEHEKTEDQEAAVPVPR